MRALHRRSSGVSSSGAGVTTRTLPPARVVNSVMLVSAMSRPRPMTSTRSAVFSISLISVAGDQDGAAFGRQALEQLPHPHDAFGVEAVDRLVEEERLRLAEQRAGDAEALRHAEREPADALAGDVAEADRRRAPRRPGSAGCRRRGPSSARWSGRSARGGRPWRRAGRRPTCIGAGASRNGRPSTVADPLVGVSSPTIIRIVVDLPAPFGPRKPVTWPGSTSNESRSTASVSP